MQKQYHNHFSDNKMPSFLIDSILCIWLMGSILFDKAFSYISVGPIFITELVLGLLILRNLKNFTVFDFIFFSAFSFYFAIGYFLHNSFLFAGKDLIWMIYVLFFRFFPKNLAPKYVSAITICGILSILTATVLSSLSIYTISKYNLIITIFFVLTYQIISSNRFRIYLTYSMLLLAAVMIDFKTGSILILLLPFFYVAKFNFRKALGVKKIIFVVTMVLTFVYFDFSRIILTSTIDFLNWTTEFLKIDKTFYVGTALWRADIWHYGLLKLLSFQGFFFGEFPGHNYMDKKFLGIDIALGGGNELGIVRSAHNIIVHIFMKTGMIGILSYLAYFSYCNRSKNNNVQMFIFCIFVMAMTSDILEVPSRGPVFFCLARILQGLSEKENAIESKTEVTSPIKQPHWPLFGIIRV